MYIILEILFAKFGFSDLYLIPTDSHLMPILGMRGAFAPNHQNIYCVLLT